MGLGDKVQGEINPWEKLITDITNLHIKQLIRRRNEHAKRTKKQG
jgi:Na+-translocating ferredoxin:NAD+ oxidoreductase RnfG subunit